MASELLEKYLMTRQLAEPTRNDDEAILADDELLGQIAVLFRTHERALKALIAGRLTPIKQALIYETAPAETIVMRQALLEVAMVYDDAERYALEHEKREKERKDANAGSTLAAPAAGEAPKIEDNVRKDNDDLTSV